MRRSPRLQNLHQGNLEDEILARQGMVGIERAVRLRHCCHHRGHRPPHPQIALASRNTPFQSEDSEMHRWENGKSVWKNHGPSRACSQILWPAWSPRPLPPSDMGGTTAKASLVERGEVTRSLEYQVGGGIMIGSRLLTGAGYMLKVPAVDLAEVGAGDGSAAQPIRSGAGPLHEHTALLPSLTPAMSSRKPKRPARDKAHP